ncbi:autophagy-related protein 17 [Suillus bovinus]|uniref:autophagy-related protein 17 n=1 Tax=Suillus bovinus TaxID=48563 RepID=UPI001B877D01|nr:autophagy-related protein 17 [Suillus bovinus]KAG2133664.1 autophagy-related protein 17 [Suillus bovinus]
MASPPPGQQTEQPHLVSLVLQSKKALQHGQQLCSKANSLSNASAQCSLDVLTLDAKVKWITEAVLEQLKLAANVAKSIEHKRAQLDKQVKAWDVVRSKRTEALDNILESLGAQLVPPGFHQSSSGSSLFGSQHSIDGRNGNAMFSAQQSPSATVRDNPFDRHGKNADRTKWKTLRDFVDESAIENVLDTLESDRTRLDDIMASTYDYPEKLSAAISSIRESLPSSSNVPSIEDILNAQQQPSELMARHLSSLTSHYEQMADALKESEAGEIFSEEDLQDMNRDTEELPSIMAELEEQALLIEDTHQQLVSAKTAAQERLTTQSITLDNLDELGEIMSDMLQKQQDVENKCQELLDGLQERLLIVEDLHHRFIQYQTSFKKLLIEIGRRRQYKEAVEKVVEGMIMELRAMTEEERQVREDFNAEHGRHIPEDICLCIENPPTRWDVVPREGEVRESLPVVESDLLAQAKEKLAVVDVSSAGTESV